MVACYSGRSRRRARGRRKVPVSAGGNVKTPAAVLAFSCSCPRWAGACVAQEPWGRRDRRAHSDGDGARDRRRDRGRRCE